MEFFISKIECCFVNLLGYCTNRREYEEKDADEITTYNLTPTQLQYANQLRKVCDNFRIDAYKNMRKHQNNNNYTRKMLQLIKNLRKDKSIHITRPDKGRGIVIMDRDDYINKMNLIINDVNTFKCIDVDPTIKKEDRLHQKLLKLKHSGFITQDEYYMY
jgi:hypothetical protein